MNKKRKPSGYWTKERCHAEALKYNTRNEFRINSTAYRKARKEGWLEELVSHMTPPKNKPHTYWSKDKCIEEAKKYKTRGAFQKDLTNAYYKSRKEGWLDEVCKHMKVTVGYWTKERCHADALNYKIRNNFRIGSASAYVKSCKMGWLGEICSHMVNGRKK